MANEFTALNGIVESQNNALVSQHAVVRDISLNIQQQASLIEKLSTRIEQLESGRSALPEMMATEKKSESSPVEAVSPVNAVLPESNETTERDGSPLSEMPVPREQGQGLAVAGTGIESDAEKSGASIVDPEVEDSGAIQPAPPIVTYTRPEQTAFSTLVLSTLLGIGVVMFGWREWVWRRRFAKLGIVADKKSTTYSPSKKPEDMGTLEIKQIEAKSKEKDSDGLQVTNKSGLRLESSTADGVKIEIEVLLAYEQYEEALQLLGLSRDKFGDADWIDYKMLEIYAATNQCEEFLGLFNDKRAVLQAGSAIAWDKITKMRDQLCDEFNISAIG